MSRSNFPPGYSEDGDAPSHGRETAIYQELVKIRVTFEKWLCDNGKDIPTEESTEDAAVIEDAFTRIENDLNQPL